MIKVFFPVILKINLCLRKILNYILMEKRLLIPFKLYSIMFFIFQVFIVFLSAISNIEKDVCKQS